MQRIDDARKHYNCRNCNRGVNRLQYELVDKTYELCNRCSDKRLHLCDTQCATTLQMCSKCHELRPLRAFSMRKNRPSHTNVCRVCGRASSSQRVKACKETHKSHNCDTLGCKGKTKYCVFHKTHHTLNQFRINRSQMTGHDQRCLLASYLLAAERCHRSWSLSNQEFWRIVSLPCFWCGESGHPYNGIDRLNNDMGYSIENCVTCCTECNFLKGRMSPQKFTTMLVRYRRLSDAHMFSVIQRISTLEENHT